MKNFCHRLPFRHNPYSATIRSAKGWEGYAGKMHALLFRKWKGRIKGRDWYDMEWYVKSNIQLHLDHFVVRSMQSGDWNKQSMSREEFRQLLVNKVDQVSIADIRDDIVRFIPDDKLIEIWSKDYFRELAHRIQFV